MRFANCRVFPDKLFLLGFHKDGLRDRTALLKVLHRNPSAYLQRFSLCLFSEQGIGAVILVQGAASLGQCFSLFGGAHPVV